jgi:hypothetical protein
MTTRGPAETLLRVEAEAQRWAGRRRAAREAGLLDVVQLVERAELNGIRARDRRGRGGVTAFGSAGSDLDAQRLVDGALYARRRRDRL